MHGAQSSALHVEQCTFDRRSGEFAQMLHVLPDHLDLHAGVGEEEARATFLGATSDLPIADARLVASYATMPIVLRPLR